LAVTIPGNLAPGNYRLHAVKGGAASNPAVISIAPPVTIRSVVSNGSDGLVTIDGSGFGGYAAGTGTSVIGPLAFSSSGYQQATFGPATVISWTDTQIVADFRGSSPDQVVVKSIFGVAAAHVQEMSQPEPASQPEPRTEQQPNPQPESKPRGDFSFGGDFSMGFEKK
jgi:hypothetical protein